jgi:hypothetical protein
MRTAESAIILNFRFITRVVCITGDNTHTFQLSLYSLIDQKCTWTTPASPQIWDVVEPSSQTPRGLPRSTFRSLIFLFVSTKFRFSKRLSLELAVTVPSGPSVRICTISQLPPSHPWSSSRSLSHFKRAIMLLKSGVGLRRAVLTFVLLLGIVSRTVSTFS